MQLLVSVKNLQEAQLALSAGVDVIDLKDPNIGAVGALDLATTAQIVHKIDGRATLSATVGENHESMSVLANEIQQRADLGVDIIKIAVNSLLESREFYSEIQKLTQQKIKLVALFFADTKVEPYWLAKLARSGFYGAMLDTQTKQHSLLEIHPKTALSEFARTCENFHLFCGMAGSLKSQDVEMLQEINPTFIGFRSGVCENGARESNLSAEKIHKIKNCCRNTTKLSS